RNRPEGTVRTPERWGDHVADDRGVHDDANHQGQHRRGHRDRVAELFAEIERAVDNLDRLAALEQQIEADDELLPQDKSGALGRIERYLDDIERASEAEAVFKSLKGDPKATEIAYSNKEGLT